jgi:hypothetical protein
MMSAPAVRTRAAADERSDSGHPSLMGHVGGGLIRVPAGERGPAARVFAAGLPVETPWPSPAALPGRIRPSSYWTVAVASPLLLNRLKMVLNSCLP